MCPLYFGTLQPLGKVIPILVDKWHSDLEVLSQLSHCSRYLSLSIGTLLGEPGGGGAALLGVLKVMKGRLWGWALSSVGLSWATWGGVIYQGL